MPPISLLDDRAWPRPFAVQCASLVVRGGGGEFSGGVGVELEAWTNVTGNLSQTIGS